ncbi:hypothetical protein ACFV6E_13700 [Streptomyces sp. NPDC059785]|uniref:hypothetical protein n=1 Tax=unclassified Streptomyces TaxID=2593676 RepID=UPI003668ADBD
MTALRHQPPRPQLQVVEVDTREPDRLGVVVRCLASTRLGARFLRVDRRGVGICSIHLTVEEIRRYPRVVVSEVAPPHAARVVLVGTGAHEVRLQPGDVLLGSAPTAASPTGMGPCPRDA